MHQKLGLLTADALPLSWRPWTVEGQIPGSASAYGDHHGGEGGAGHDRPLRATPRPRKARRGCRISGAEGRLPKSGLEGGRLDLIQPVPEAILIGILRVRLLLILHTLFGDSGKIDRAAKTVFDAAMSESGRMKRFVALERARALKHQGELQKAELVLKSLNVVGAGMLKEGMAVPYVLEKYPSLEQQFETGITADPLLLMIDLSPFSSLVADWPPEEISLFLQRYYRVVTTRVADVGGVVEKYIGDAVIAIFGEPFKERTTLDNLEGVIQLARSLVKEIEWEFEGEVTAKCSIAHGTCHFGYLGPPEHTELTIVGAPLTILFRLEAECPERSVILPGKLFDQVDTRFPLVPSGIRSEWVRKRCQLSLRGVGGLEVVISTLKA